MANTFTFPSAPSDSVQPLRQGGLMVSKTAYYEIKSFLGQGSFGKVAKCHRINDKKTVALKLIRNQDPFHWGAQTELAALKELKKLDADSCNIIQLHHAFFDKGYICLEFDCLDISLYDFMDQRQFKPLLVSEIRPIVQQMAVALYHLQTLGLMHADLKPGNIMMVNHKEEPYRVKLIDFGLATKVSAAEVGSYIQSRPYRSPEVFLGLPLTEAIDMWSLGCMAVFLYTGTLLYFGDTEYDMLQSIVETQGPLPAVMLDKGMKTQTYFYKEISWKFGVPSAWKLKTPENYQKESGRVLNDKRTIKLKSLNDLSFARPVSQQNGAEKVAEVSDRAMFVDMVKGMLQLDPSVRKTPQEILLHPFICMSHLDANITTAYAHSAYGIMESHQQNKLLDQPEKFQPEPKEYSRPTTQLPCSSRSSRSKERLSSHHTQRRERNHVHHRESQNHKREGHGSPGVSYSTHFRYSKHHRKKVSPQDRKRVRPCSPSPRRSSPSRRYQQEGRFTSTVSHRRPRGKSPGSNPSKYSENQCKRSRFTSPVNCKRPRESSPSTSARYTENQTKRSRQELPFTYSSQSVQRHRSHQDYSGLKRKAEHDVNYYGQHKRHC